MTDVPEATPQTSSEKRPRNILPVFLITFLVISLGLNAFLLLKYSNLTGEAVSTDLKYVSPIGGPSLDSQQESILHYQGLGDILSAEIQKSGNNGKVGVFVQNPKTGAWSGINEKEGFAPASLLKLPIMMAILKKVQRQEMNLDDEIKLLPSDLSQSYGELYQAGAGAEFKISELLHAMITNSDNTALYALKRQLSDEELDSVFVHVGVPNPYLTEEHTISPRDYMRIFKSLYYSTYLTPELSEFALDLTTDSVEENLLSQGIPPEIQVAHKFGIRDTVLHDCGIVYHPQNLYFICVMTKDIEQSQAKNLITNISTKVYEFIDTRSS